MLTDIYKVRYSLKNSVFFLEYDSGGGKICVMSLISPFMLSFSVWNDVALGYFVAFGISTTFMMFLFCNGHLNKWKHSVCFCFMLVYVFDTDIPSTGTLTSGWRTAPSVWLRSKAQWTWTETTAQCWTFTLWVQTQNLRLCFQHFLILCYSNSLMCYIYEQLSLQILCFLQLTNLITLI